MIDLLGGLWLDAIYKPVYNLVIFTYNLTPGPSFGLAVIGLAVFIRFIFLYFTLRGYRHDQQLLEVKPLIEQVEKDNRLTPRDKIKQIRELTRPHGIDPVLASVPFFAQLVFLGALYQIIQSDLKHGGFEKLYSFVHTPTYINSEFFSINLFQPSLLLSLIAAGTLFLERVWEYNERKQIGKSFSQKWDPLIWPLGSFIILMILPSAKAIFLTSSVAFSLVIKGIIHLNAPSES